MGAVYLGLFTVFGQVYLCGPVQGGAAVYVWCVNVEPGDDESLRVLGPVVEARPVERRHALATKKRQSVGKERNVKESFVRATKHSYKIMLCNKYSRCEDTI